MAEGQTVGSRFLNPCVLHLQKMELELKCPACLNLLNNPVLLPCNHICCSLCIPKSAEHAVFCPACKFPSFNRDLRSIPHLETIVTVFKSMTATFAANLLQPRVGTTAHDATSPSHEKLMTCNGVIDDKHHKEVMQSSSKEKLINTQSSITGQGACINERDPCSPPSFGDIKNSDDDSNDSGSGHTLPIKGLCKRKLEDDVTRKPASQLTSSHEDSLLCRRSDSGKSIDNVNENPTYKGVEVSVGECKRQKLETEFNNNISGSLQHFKSEDDHNNTSEFSVTCVFCHSSRESEASGPMLHYDDGNPVEGAQALQPNVLHVHQKCIDWAPQVYFVGDIAKNLDAEISRAAKIKCSKCGQKGAALGCYAKSCRKSFHVPCAVGIPDCRWDSDNFLLLCPAHFSHKFPSDRSKTKKEVKNNNRSPTALDGPKTLRDHPPMKQGNNEEWTSTPEMTREWVLCGSALSSAESNLLARFARLTGATVSRDWTSNVTHVIASTDNLGACSRTLKYLLAILSGKWILRVDWIKACMDAKTPIPEDCFEINHDIHGCFDGPRNGRMRIMEKAPPLFTGLSFHFCGDFVPSYKGYLEELISVAGGAILKELDFSLSDEKPLLPTSYMVYSLDPPQECDSANQAESIKKRREEAEALATKSGSQVVGHTWVLDSIAACKIQPLVAEK